MGRGHGASYRVAVRALCEFTAKVGDLDLRFTPSPTALEGIAGHVQVTARRGDGYEREIALEGQYGQLSVRGRADGYDPARNRPKRSRPFAATGTPARQSSPVALGAGEDLWLAAVSDTRA